MKAIPLQELEWRWKRCRDLLKAFVPEAEGMFIFSRVNIYYFSGTYANGLFWLPLEGPPVLLCRRGIERALLESPLETIVSFGSYKEVEDILSRVSSCPSRGVAVEKDALSWSLGERFSKYLSRYRMVPGDRIPLMTRAVKSEFELKILREAGSRHAICMIEHLPPLLKAGMSEFEIARIMSDLFFEMGNHGIMRMQTHGQELFMGYYSIGDSGNYPSVFNGPLGLRGAHPAIPYLGSDERKWTAGEILTIDNGFNWQGYHTDKTQVFWLGPPSGIPASIRSAHDCCLEIQSRIAAEMKPGAIPSELWRQSVELAKRHGYSDGYMGLDGNKVFFVGHGIGLAVDEYPALAQGFDAPLEAGMTLAIEPKIGIPGVGMVGTENTFEVTPGGVRCLTGDHYEMMCID